MVHTMNAVCYDAAGNIVMMVFPDDDSQLDDPAFNPPGATQLRVPVQTLHAKPMLGKQAAASPGDATNHMIAAAAAMGVTIQLAPLVPQ